MIQKLIPTRLVNILPQVEQKPDLRLLPNPVPEKPATLRVHLISISSKDYKITTVHARLFNSLLDELEVSGKFRMCQTPNYYHPSNKDACSVRFLVDSNRLKIRVCDSKNCFSYVVEREDEKKPATELFGMFLERLFYFFVEGNKNSTLNWKLVQPLKV